MQSCHCANRHATAAAIANRYGRDLDRNADNNSHHPNDSDSSSSDYPDPLDYRTLLSISSGCQRSDYGPAN